jgi:DNA-binding MarR family transcriptional regulator
MKWFYSLTVLTTDFSIVYKLSPHNKGQFGDMNSNVPHFRRLKTMISSQNLSTHHKSLVTAERKATFQALYAALEPFAKDQSGMTLGNLMTFLRVGMDEGKGVGEYAQDAGVWQTVMTRHLLDLGARDRYGKDGLGWITQARQREDLRTNRSYITQKGVAMIDTARRALDLLTRK